jgi:hypothetical protein
MHHVVLEWKTGLVECLIQLLNGVSLPYGRFLSIQGKS